MRCIRTSSGRPLAPGVGAFSEFHRAPEWWWSRAQCLVYVVWCSGTVASCDEGALSVLPTHDTYARPYVRICWCVAVPSSSGRRQACDGVRKHSPAAAGAPPRRCVVRGAPTLCSAMRGKEEDPLQKSCTPTGCSFSTSHTYSSLVFAAPPPSRSVIYCDEYGNAWFEKWGPNSTVKVGGSEEVRHTRQGACTSAEPTTRRGSAGAVPSPAFLPVAHVVPTPTLHPPLARLSSIYPRPSQQKATGWRCGPHCTVSYLVVD
jgi:hypothetical protein